MITTYFVLVFENKDKIILVQEFADGGELYDYISSKGKLTEREARLLFRQIVSAVHYLHEVSQECSAVIADLFTSTLSRALSFNVEATHKLYIFSRVDGLLYSF